MPRIPRKIAENVIQSPTASEFLASRTSRAGAQLGLSIAGAGEAGMKIAKAEQSAERAHKSLEIENSLREDVKNFSETFRDRIDYENFDKLADNQLKEIHDKYAGKVGNDQALGLAFERMFNQYSGILRDVVRSKKHQVITEKALGEYLKSYNQDLEDYSLETDSAKRDLIKKNLELKTMSLVSNHIMTLVQAETYIRNFKDEAEGVRASKLIEIDAKKAEQDLKGGEFDLNPKLERRLIEKALAKQRQNEVDERIRKNEAERKQKKAEEEAHDKEEDELFQFFHNGEYSKASEFLSKTQFLDGLEKRGWKIAILQESRRKPELDYTVYAEWSNKVNLDPKSIKSKSEIWGVQGLTTEKKEELSDLWEKKLKTPDDPKGNRAKRYHAMLNALKTKYVFDENEIKNQEIYGEKANQLDLFFKNNPDAKDKEVEDYFKGLVKDETDAWWSKAWNTISNFFSVGATPEAPTPPTKEDERRKKAIKILEEGEKPVTEKNIKFVMDQM